MPSVLGKTKKGDFMIRIGIFGYGNLGRGVESAIRRTAIWSLRLFLLAAPPKA